MYLTFFRLEENLTGEWFETFLRKVSPKRREICRRQKGETAAALRLLTAVWTRAYLSAALGVSNRELRFERTADEKPYLCGNALSFNFSHAGEAFAFACSREPVGVDLERPRKMRRGLIERYYSGAERALIASGTDPVLLWTKKESMLKLRGDGLRGIESADTASAKDVFFDTRRVGEYYLTAASFSDREITFETLSFETLARSALALEDLPE